MSLLNNWEQVLCPSEFAYSKWNYQLIAAITTAIAGQRWSKRNEKKKTIYTVKKMKWLSDGVWSTLIYHVSVASRWWCLEMAFSRLPGEAFNLWVSTSRKEAYHSSLRRIMTAPLVHVHDYRSWRGRCVYGALPSEQPSWRWTGRFPAVVKFMGPTGINGGRSRYIVWSICSRWLAPAFITTSYMV